MSEPTTLSAAATAGLLITVAGIPTGLPSDLVFPGFVGALWALRAIETGGVFARVGQVLAGTLLAAWSAHPVAQIAGGMLPASLSIATDSLRYPAAFCVGWGGLTIGLRWIGRLLGDQKR